MHAFFSAHQHLVTAIWLADCVVLSVLFFLQTGFEAACIRWIRVLCCKPVASVDMNAMIFFFLIHFFWVFQCTQRGCPASPAVFIWAREPACAVQAEQEITGVAICDYNFKPQMPSNLTFTQKIILLSYQIIDITTWYSIMRVIMMIQAFW